MKLGLGFHAENIWPWAECYASNWNLGLVAGIKPFSLELGPQSWNLEFGLFVEGEAEEEGEGKFSLFVKAEVISLLGTAAQK